MSRLDKALPRGSGRKLLGQAKPLEKAVSLKPASAHIFDSLRQKILDGHLAPGLQVRQELVAEEFGVSRVPVREALRQLEAEGLLTSELNKGAFVSSRSLAEVIEMLDIRIGLEVRALKLA